MQKHIGSDKLGAIANSVSRLLLRVPGGVTDHCWRSCLNKTLAGRLVERQELHKYSQRRTDLRQELEKLFELRISVSLKSLVIWSNATGAICCHTHQN